MMKAHQNFALLSFQTQHFLLQKDFVNKEEKFVFQPMAPIHHKLFLHQGEVRSSGTIFNAPSGIKSSHIGSSSTTFLRITFINCFMLMPVDASCASF